MNGEYDDIIKLEHYVSKKRPQMPMINRAAQFAPFAALTGYGETVKETARRTDSKIEIDETQIEILNAKLKILSEKIGEKPIVSIEYFVNDERKYGGKYEKFTCSIIKIDILNSEIVTDYGVIPIDNILSVDGEIFEDFY